ncbi:MAG: hypothetical protein ACXADY_20545 [Candidatus Hodarchaeales archaeon]|jgi:hypothetical protein
MVSRHETYKKFLRTVTDQLPEYIMNYEPEEQTLLENFRLIIQECELKAEKDRNSLLWQLQDFNLKIRSLKDYTELSFLWFCADYVSNANLLLNVADYHAEEFYQYLVTYIRNNPDLPGVFQLIRDNISLNDPKWEMIQYECINPPPLMTEDIKAIEAVYRFIEKEGIEVLNPTRLRAEIKEQVNSRILNGLYKLFTLMNAYWYLWFFPPAFGIEGAIFHFQLSETTSLEEIIDIRKTENGILGMSNIFQIRNLPKAYIGIFYTPDHLVNQLIKYFQYYDQKGKLSLQKASRVSDMQIGFSLKRYQPEKGWLNFTTTEWNRLSRQMSSDRLQDIPEIQIPYFTSTAFNQNWNFLKHTNPTRAANLYCIEPRKFNINSLPFSIKPKNQNYSIREKAHLKELYNNRVVQIIFQVDRLNFAFSLDLYWIILPNNNQLSWLLRELPYSHLFYTKEETHIWSLLTSDLAEKLQTDLNWTVLPIITIGEGCKRTIEFFNQETLKWKNPIILQDFIT